MIIIVVVVIVASSQIIANIILFTQSTSCVPYSHCSASNRFIRLLQTARQRFCSSFPTAGRRLRHLVPPSLPLSLPLPSFLFPFPCSSSNLRNCGRSWSFSQSSQRE